MHLMLKLHGVHNESSQDLIRSIEGVVMLRGFVRNPSELRLMERASSLEYWLHWPSLLCEFIVLVAFVAAVVVVFKCERLVLVFKCGRLRSSDEHRRKGTRVYEDELWRPCWRTITPLGLLAYRGILFFLLTGLLIGYLRKSGFLFFYFYTQWTFTLVILYFGLATLISMEGCYQWYKQGSIIDHRERTNILTVDTEHETYAAERARENISGISVSLQNYREWQENRKKAGFWGYAMQIIFQTCAGAVVMTDIVFWVIIVPFLSTNRFSLNLLMGSMHTVNAFFLIVDSCLNSMQFPWFRGAYFVLWTAVYVIFQWILHACGFSWWPYPFLELSTPWAPLWYFALALLCIPCYGIYALLIKAKQRFFPKWFPRAYRNL